MSGEKNALKINERGWFDDTGDYRKTQRTGAKYSKTVRTLIPMLVLTLKELRIIRKFNGPFREQCDRFRNVTFI